MSNVSDGDLLFAEEMEDDRFSAMVVLTTEADAKLTFRFHADDVSDTQLLVEGL